MEESLTSPDVSQHHPEKLMSPGPLPHPAPIYEASFQQNNITIETSQINNPIGLELLALPHISFSSAFKVTSMNRLARSLFGLSSESKTLLGMNASFLLTENGEAEESDCGRVDGESFLLLQESLLEASRQLSSSSTRYWDEGLRLAYWTGSRGSRLKKEYEAIIQRFPIPALTPATQDLDTTKPMCPLRLTPPSADPRTLPLLAPPQGDYTLSILFLRNLPLINTPPVSMPTVNSSTCDCKKSKEAAVQAPNAVPSLPRVIVPLVTTDADGNPDEKSGIGHYFNSLASEELDEHQYVIFSSGESEKGY